MAIILVVVYTKGLRSFSGIAIGGIVVLDIFFFAFISGASSNPQSEIIRLKFPVGETIDVTALADL